MNRERRDTINALRVQGMSDVQIARQLGCVPRNVRRIAGSRERWEDERASAAMSAAQARASRTPPPGSAPSRVEANSGATGTRRHKARASDGTYRRGRAPGRLLSPILPGNTSREIEVNYGPDGTAYEVLASVEMELGEAFALRDRLLASTPVAFVEDADECTVTEVTVAHLTCECGRRFLTDDGLALHRERLHR